MSYKWSNPYNWLADVSRGWEEAVLYAALCRLAAKLDSDTIQNAFENEMDVDGYFEDEPSQEYDNDMLTGGEDD